MPTELEKCEQQAKHLPLEERAVLISRLIEGLDELDEQNLQRLWLQEASRRFKEYKDGNIYSQESSEVFHNARAKLQGMR